MGLLGLHQCSLPQFHRHQHSFLSKPNPSSFSLFPIPHLSSKSSTIYNNGNNNNNNSNRGHQLGESAFLDEDGVVEDMDGYLNSLSLEYDSVWDTKPSWCQPWTILLTGVLAVTCSWLFLHSTIISGGVLFIISTWWYLFLYAYPKAYTNMIEERRNKVNTGIEDTFGVRRSQ